MTAAQCMIASKVIFLISLTLFRFNLISLTLFFKFLGYVELYVHINCSFFLINGQK